MKILQIAPAWIDTPPNGYGGTELVIYNIAKGFVELGHEVTIFATKNSKSPGNLEYVFDKSFLDMKIEWIGAQPALIHYHQALQNAADYDIIHAHLSSQTDPVFMPLLSDLHKKGIATIMTIHGHWPYDRFTWMDAYYKKFYAKDIATLSISKTMQKLLPKEFVDYGFIHNSVDPDTYTFREKHKNYVTWLGKILPDKGTHEAILAAKEAGEKIVFAGVVEDNDRTSPSVEYFETKVKPLIDNDQVVYLGPADVKMKNELLGSAKAFLNPLHWEEPFGMVMAESMVCGTPVIAYKRGAAPELIKHGKTGYLVKTRKEMVNALKRVNEINRKETRAHMEKYFSPIAAAEKHLKAYQRRIEEIKKVIKGDEVIKRKSSQKTRTDIQVVS
jgi:glycosyltransferase involved in cell wall biosynthesis